MKKKSILVQESIFLCLLTDHQSKLYKQKLGNRSHETESSQQPITLTYDVEDGSTLNVGKKLTEQQKQ